MKVRAMLPAGVAMVVIARRGAGELKWTAIDAELGASVVSLGRKLGGKFKPITRTESGRA
jgi:hypothetical protein